MAQQVATLRWGIAATGWISDKFVRDLLVDPSRRRVADGTSHRVVAVSSRSVDKAREFVASIPGLDVETTACYGKLLDMIQDNNVEVIYIGTPHSQHYLNAKDVIQAGKHVLVEKPCTVTGPQAAHLLTLAAKHRVFFMEAVWTRFHPLTRALSARVSSGEIGDVIHVRTNFSVDINVARKMADSHRLVLKETAGGSLLDLGPYTFLYLPILFPELFDGSRDSLPRIAASGSLHSSGIDISTSTTLTHPTKTHLTATMSTSFVHMTPLSSCVEVVGTKGYILVDWPPFRPEGFTVVKWNSESESQDVMGPGASGLRSFSSEHVAIPHPDGVYGLSWQADEVARCIRAGKQECETVSWSQTLLEMRLFDEIRAQIGLDYGSSLQMVATDKQ